MQPFRGVVQYIRVNKNVIQYSKILQKRNNLKQELLLETLGSNVQETLEN